jgi:hypothetical protein
MTSSPTSRARPPEVSRKLAPASGQLGGHPKTRFPTAEHLAGVRDRPPWRGRWDPPLLRLRERKARRRSITCSQWTNRNRSTWLVLMWDVAVQLQEMFGMSARSQERRDLASGGLARYGWPVKSCSQRREPCQLSVRWSMSPVVPVRRRPCRGSTDAEHRATKDNANPPIRRPSMRSSRSCARPRRPVTALALTA